MRKLYYNAIRKRDQTVPIPPTEIKISIMADTHLRAGVDGDPLAPNAGTSNARAHYASPSKLRGFVAETNTLKPDHVIHLGDMVDTPNDFPYFHQEWAKITTPKTVTVGNHDFDDFTYEELVSILGYDEKPELGGSKFNQSFKIEKDDLSVRIIMLDVNFSLTDTHINTARGALHSQSFGWLEQEITNATEDYILLFSHIGPHLLNYPSNWPYFEESHALQVQSIVANSGKTVHAFFGHAHNPNIVKLTNLGATFPGYRLPDTIETETGHYTVLTVTKETLVTEKNTLVYPYP